jgi:hypothetical protein
MKRVIILLLVMLSVVEASAQKKVLREESNRFMSLDIKKPGTIKRIKFYENDKIIFKVKTYRGRFKGMITNLTDTTLTLDNITVVSYKDIAKVLVDNNNSLTKVARAFLMTAGGGYIALDIVNNLITSTSPVINPRTIIIGAALVVIGQSIKWLSVKHYKIDKNHRIKYIDDNP